MACRFSLFLKNSEKRNIVTSNRVHSNPLNDIFVVVL